MASPDKTSISSPDTALAAEAGLRRELRPRQLAMIALGGSIGTGLFLGSAVSVQAAGPGVILSYIAGAVVALTVAFALAEMAATVPVAGSFGVYAEMYVHPWAGFTARYSYWLAQAVNVGSEVAAAAIYCRYWLPEVPGWIWVAAFSAALIYVNARAVGSFGEFEYWFAMIKVATIFIFIAMGCALILGVGFSRIGFANYTSGGGFLPHGWTGVWLGISMSIFSYLGTEAVAVTAGEAKDPATALPRAMRSMFGRLALFYVGGIAVLVGVMPWTEAGLAESPFVRVFKTVGIPAVAALMNFVVLTAALSSMNTNLYLCSRMLFSLARGGYAPALLGRLSRTGSPVAALMVSSVGMAIALFLQFVAPKAAYLQMLGASFFGGLFAWIIILVTHFSFRRRFSGALVFRAPFYPWASAAGLAALVAITISTWWVPGLKITLAAGLPWLAIISVCYLLWAQMHKRAYAPASENKNG